MKQLKIRFAQPDEAETITKWLNDNPHNRYDKGILQYPTLRVLCSYNDKPRAYLPTHNALILESCALNPENPGLENAQALRDLVKAAELIASGQGMREIYFLDGGGGVGEMARGHGFEEVNMKVFRLRL